MKSRRRWTNTIKRNHPLKRMWSLTRWGGHVRQKPETYFLWNQADFTRSNRKRISKMDLLPISILWKKKTFTWRTKGKGRLHASSFRCSYSCPEEGIVTFWQSRFRTVKAGKYLIPRLAKRSLNSKNLTSSISFGRFFKVCIAWHTTWLVKKMFWFEILRKLIFLYILFEVYVLGYTYG